MSYVGICHYPSRCYKKKTLQTSTPNCFKDVEGIIPRNTQCPLCAGPREKFLFVLNTKNSCAAPEQLAPLILWTVNVVIDCISLSRLAPKGLGPNL